MLYCYSTDGEIFSGESFDTIEEAVECALGYDADIESVYIGERVEIDVASYVNAYSILDNIADNIADESYEQIDDSSKGWLGKILNDKQKLDELKKLIGDWIIANDPPSFFKVSNIQKIDVAELMAAEKQSEAQ